MGENEKRNEEISNEKVEIVNKEEVVNKDKKIDNKKILMIVGIVLFIVGILIIFMAAIFGANVEDNKKDDNKVNNSEYKNKTYFVYVDIVPAFKVSVEEKYTKCSTGECLVEIIAKDFELIEEDKNKVFDNYDFKESELNKALGDLLDRASNKGVDVSDVDFYSSSYEIGSYLNLNIGTYAFYYSESVDEVDEFYNRESENTGDEENPVIPIVIKEIRIDNPDILVKNPTKGYSYSLTKPSYIVVTMRGFLDEVEGITKDYFNFSIDVAGSEVGTHDFLLLYGIPFDVEIELSPSTVSVVVGDKNNNTTTTTTTSKKSTSSTKSSTTTSTTKTTSRCDVEINLNDNIQVYKITSCGGYESIKKECINANIGELKTMYPDYNKELDREDYLTDSMKLEGYYSLEHYFPGCILNISDSTKSKLTNIKGMYPTYPNSHVMRPQWIGFKDYAKYKMFTWDIADFSKYNLYYDAPCGGGGGEGPTYYTLDEELCREYNLPCARW